MLSAIVAMDTSGLIGSRGKLPWYLPDDLKRFKKITMGHPVIMGRKTFDSIGKPLPGRKNIVLTRDKIFSHTDVHVFYSVDDILTDILGEEESIVIGGAEIFKLFLPFIEKLYFTVVEHEFEGDVYMPAIDMSLFRLIYKEKHKSSKDFPYPYTYMTYVKK